MKRGVPALVAELVRAHPFPDPRRADARGLLAYGGDLEPERLVAAYAQGVFPWYDEEPILWYSPDPRMLLAPARLHVGRSLARRVRAQPYALTMDTAFGEVVRGCATAARPGQQGTWIGRDMIAAYERLHALGFAHSVEAWAPPANDPTDETPAEVAAGEAPVPRAGRHLVGGLYGVSLGRAFFGESMFARSADASKIAFVAFVRQLERWGFDFVDCQVETRHLARFGAYDVSRRAFLDLLAAALEGETRLGRWRFDDSGPDAAR